MQLALVGAALGELAVVVQFQAVIGHEHDDRVVGQVQLVDGLQQVADPGIDQRAAAGIQRARVRSIWAGDGSLTRFMAPGWMKSFNVPSLGKYASA